MSKLTTMTDVSNDPRVPDAAHGAIDPRVAVAKRIVLRLGLFVIFTLVVSAVFAIIHLATDRPVKDVLGF
jgi:hypothetical protein